MSTPLDRKLCGVDEAVTRIADGATVAIGGFIGSAVPEALLCGIEQLFVSAGRPRDLTLLYGAGQGDAKDRGINHFGHEGLVKRVIGGHWALGPKLGALAIANKIEAYNFPQGVICQLIRDIAAGRPGCITHVGLDTFIDPIHDGGRLNDRTPPGLVERIVLGGKTWLWYKAMPIDVAIIRATAADPLGNLVMTEEAVIGEALPLAQAAHNCGGMVIAQVKQRLDTPANPHLVRVPGILVDHIVIGAPEHHQQTFAEPFDPAFCNPATTVSEARPKLEPMPLDARRIIAARALAELPAGAIANLGIGMPEGIARLAAERGLLDQFTLTVESGPIGGAPAGGLSFGASVHPHAIIDQPAQFDFYDGRGLDYAALGAAQIDQQGNVNVSKFGQRFTGVGGFVNISQNAKRLVFCGAFTAGGLEVTVADGQLKIVVEGRVKKFVSQVEQLSFSAARSRAAGQELLYVTERAVFRLCDQGLELTQIAPGIDLQKHVLDQMTFRPAMRDIKPMPVEHFRQG
jgi:propionate CoA-transferase